MKKFLIHIICFSFLLSIVFAILNVFQSVHHLEPTHHTAKYEALTNEANELSGNINGIVIGNSHGAYSIRPSEMKATGVNFYNLAFGRADVTFYHKLLEEFPESHLTKRGEITHCIITVDSYFIGGRNRRRLEEDAEYMSLTTLSKLFFRGNIDRGSLLLNYFPAFKYRKKLIRTLENFGNESPFKVEKFDDGFIPYERLYDKENFTVNKRKFPVFSESSRVAFRLLLDKLIEKKMKIYLVMTREYKLEQSEYSDLRSFINQITIDYDLPFFDYNKAPRSGLFQDASYFSDRGHLNGKGSLQLSKDLAKSIKAYESQQPRK